MSSTIKKNVMRFALPVRCIIFTRNLSISRPVMPCLKKSVSERAAPNCPLWQANHVADLIRDCHGDRPVEIKTYRTRGDVNQKAALPLIGGKGIFTEALEKALRRREIDFAVHSLKDLPVENADGLAIGAIPERGDHRDVLLSPSGATLAQLPTGARLGTGSLRRRAQLLALRPDLQMMDIRGNVSHPYREAAGGRQSPTMPSYWRPPACIAWR